MNNDYLIEIFNSDNYVEKILELSFEQRLNIACSSDNIINYIFTKILQKGITFFNKEESIRIINDTNVFRIVKHNLYEFPNIFDLANLPDDILYKAFLNSGIDEFAKNIKDHSILINNLNEIIKKYYFRFIIPSLTDFELEKLLARRDLRDYRREIFLGFKSDEYRLRNLHYLKRYDRWVIIQVLSDENKKRFINPFQNLSDIQYFSDDAEKEKIFQKYWFMIDDESKSLIIKSFKNMDYVIRNLKYLKSEKARYYFVNYMLFRGKYQNMTAEKINIIKDILLSIHSEKYLVKIIKDCFWDLKDIGLESLIYILLGRVSSQKELAHLFILGSEEIFDELFEYTLPKLEPSTINIIADKRLENIKNYKILLHITNDELLYKVLEHATFCNEYSDDMLPLFEKIAKRYNVNLNHLIQLTKVTGCTILKQINNENIQNALNLDEQSFKKYLKIFDENNYTISSNSLSSILNSLLNRKFSIEFPEKINIFINTLHAIKDGDIDDAIDKIHQVIDGIDLSKYGIDEKTLINGILNNDEQIIKIYNRISYEYLTNERNNYVNGIMKNTIGGILVEKYEINELIKYIFKIMPEDIIYDFLSEIYEDNPKEYFMQNPTLLKSLIHFKKKPSSGLNNDIKPYLHEFNNFLKKSFEKIRKCKKEKIEGLKTEYIFPTFSKETLVEIMRNIDVQKLNDLVLSNEDIYEELLRYLDSYDLLGWPNVQELSKVAAEVDVELYPGIISSLISNFELIMKKKQEGEKRGERFTLTAALGYATFFSSDANIYKQIFGDENYQYLQRDPGPNASTETKSNRLKKALEYMKVMHERKYITVPPADKDYELSNGKTINIMIGNTNDPINLTYGERTGACMRIGGAGSRLFDFCIKNENGFHISFVNPKTRKLVSRVSCYRNGNTVFLNQLRNSLSQDYSDNDVIEACRLIGNEIIESTKNSKYPVMNVVSSPYYALNKMKTVNMNCHNSTHGFIHPPYTDIGSDVVVIATAKGKLSPIELGPKKAERYEVGRCHVCRYDINSARKVVTHIEALDVFYSGKPIEDIDIKEKNIIYAWAGEDWYIAITEDGEIIKYVSRTSRNLEKANKEMNKYLIIFLDEIKKAEIEESYTAEREGKVI